MKPYEKNINKIESVLQFVKRCDIDKYCPNCYYKIQCGNLLNSINDFLDGLEMYKYKKVVEIKEG